MTDDIAQCPQCGWTGSEFDFDVDGADQTCPVCGHSFDRV